MSAAARARRKPSPSPPAPVLQLRIELDDVDPLVWRRVLVPATITLGRLHEVIQTSMGWTDSHLHEFVIDGQHYGIPGTDDGMLPYRVLDERRARLQGALHGRRRFDYIYDFGDSWEHRIRVEKTLPPLPMPHPFFVDGERACPPEDVGGFPGFENFVRIMADPADPEHEEMVEWYGGPFDPGAFDAVQTRRLLEQIKL
jgi:hypothetical protein